MLCSVALLTVTPPICTGFKTAFGLSVPVRPTLTTMSSSFVRASRGLNLKAIAQRGSRATDSETLLQRKLVHFDDDAVDLVVELVAALLPIAQYATTSSSVRAHVTCGFTGNPRSRNRSNAAHCVTAGLAPPSSQDELIGKKRKPPLRRQRRIELAYAAGRRVARIGEDRLAACFTLGIEPFEIALSQVDFAARFDEAAAASPARLRVRVSGISSSS